MSTRLRIISCVATAALALVPATFAATAASASGGQTVTTGLSADALATELAGPGVTVSNAKFTGDARAVGSFSGMSAVGLDSGVALSTGSVTEDLPGPRGAKLDTDLGTAGDADADALAGAPTNDAAALEFDIVPNASTLSIGYVFGSSEYDGYVGKGYNDVFGFFVNGVNCALIDGTPVGIDTINATTNSGSFVDNTDPKSPTVVDTALAGFTKPLECSAPVNKGQVNHVKLVIADAGDARMDSAILIAANGFASNTAPTAGDIDFTVSGGKSATVTFPGADADGDALSYSLVSQPQHGAFVPSATGGVYTPAVDFVGTDSFQYSVSDGFDVSPTYTVSITVTKPSPVAPAVRNVSYTAVAGEDTPITLVAAEAVATSASVAPLTFTIEQEPSNGVLSGVGAARSYRSAVDFTGIDTFSYSSARGILTSEPTTVKLDVVSRPVPQVQTRAVPVFPAPAVPVEQNADRRTDSLANTGSDAGTLIGIAVSVLLTGIALTTATVLRRRTSAGDAR